MLMKIMDSFTDQFAQFMIRDILIVLQPFQTLDLRSKHIYQTMMKIDNGLGTLLNVTILCLEGFHPKSLPVLSG